MKHCKVFIVKLAVNYWQQLSSSGCILLHSKTTVKQSTVDFDSSLL